MTGSTNSPFASSASDSFLYLPSRAGKAAIAEVKRRNETRLRFGWGVQSLDDYITPMMPGDLCSIIARPGHGKTSCMIHLTRVANLLLSSGIDEAEGKMVFYVTWETLVEEFTVIQHAYNTRISMLDVGRGRADVESLEASIAEGIDQRIAVVGQSLNDDSPMRTLPTMEDVDQVLYEAREELGITPSLLLMDYLQRIPARDPRKDRSSVVTENLERAKDMALRHRCPVVIGIQAKREVDDYKGLRLASMSDGQWTSNIEQTSDKVFAITRPSQYMPVGQAIDDPRLAGEGEEGGYSVTKTSFGFGIVKQRWADAGATMMLDLNPAACVVSEAERLEVAY